MRKVYVDGSTTRTATSIDGVAQVLPIGKKVSNNRGEYLAIIEGLWRAFLLHLTEVEILSDSQLVIRQLNTLLGLPTDIRYKIKSPTLWALANRVKKLVDFFDCVKFTWTPRTANPAGKILG